MARITKRCCVAMIAFSRHDASILRLNGSWCGCVPLRSTTPDSNARPALRRPQQAQWLHLPLLPPTTISLFPQTRSIRLMRRCYHLGDASEQVYRIFSRGFITPSGCRKRWAWMCWCMVRRSATIWLSISTNRGILLLYGARLGAELRLPLCEAAIISGEVSRLRLMTVAWRGVVMRKV